MTYRPRHVRQLPRIFAGLADLIETAPGTPGYTPRHAKEN